MIVATNGFLKELSSTAMTRSCKILKTVAVDSKTAESSWNKKRDVLPVEEEESNMTNIAERSGELFDSGLY